ncbi:MAG: acyl-CoA thioesterase [Candidatus Omnitrophica bacterium]|nr:acyl-CoA thioesterase [Candidatus Omnitrophota bacterium]MBU2044309.1 acyl-CoA thioesterase [Candidatus Omnitrophota bacterium]MBU2250923.1 acyl-CoA thioesterase [Candidatus Omnitrophota bacterium]MBU2265777.1 acyl-CoA thioesterase [Candidatus Omnitrophota bacterium]
MHELNKKIYYHDTDCGGVVYYANYLKYFEEARTEFLLAKGIDTAKLAKANTWFVVASVEISYKAPAHYADSLVIFSEIIKKKNVSLEFKQEIKREGKLLVSAVTKLVCVDSDFKPKGIPEEVAGVLN